MRIGLFDSGIGGFTVLKKVIELCPNNSFIYLADTARLPYGIKTTNEIKKIAEEISSWFNYQKIDAFLVACNTTNAIALDVLKNNLDVPVFDLIGSAATTIQCVHHTAGASGGPCYSMLQRVGVLQLVERMADAPACVKM